MIYLDCVRIPLERIENVGRDLEYFGIWNHGVVGTRNIEVALVKLSHAALGHRWLVAAIHLSDLVSLEVLDARIHGEPSCKRNGEIVAQ